MSAEERTKWDRKHAERGLFPVEPSGLLAACQNYLPRVRGRGLDLAGGSGRHAFWLAYHGFEVTLADISEAALRIASEEARVRGLALETLCTDLEEDPFPAGPWDIILSVHYLCRPLFGEFAKHLSSDGILVFAQPTVRNLERHARPSARFLLNEGELRELADENGLDILHYQEDWSAEGRHEALLIGKSVE